MQNYCKNRNQVLKEQITKININQKEQYRHKKAYLNYLLNPNFPGVNRVSFLSVENNGDRKTHAGYFTQKVEIKDYNVIIDG